MTLFDDITNDVYTMDFVIEQQSIKMNLGLGIPHRKVREVHKCLSVIFFLNDTYSGSFFELEPNKLLFNFLIDKRLTLPPSFVGLVYLLLKMQDLFNCEFTLPEFLTDMNIKNLFKIGSFLCAVKQSGELNAEHQPGILDRIPMTFPRSTALKILSDYKENLLLFDSYIKQNFDFTFLSQKLMLHNILINLLRFYPHNDI
jgi:hypothetical protein